MKCSIKPFVAQNNKFMIARSARLVYGSLCAGDVKLGRNIKLNCVWNISPATQILGNAILIVNQSSTCLSNLV